MLGLPGYGQFYKGNHITTMSYDWWVGRSGHQYDGKRFTLQEIYLSALAHALYDDARDPSGEPSWWGLQKKQNLSTWNNHIELLAMVEDTNDGEFLAPPPNGGAVHPNAGPIWVAPFKYELSDQTVQVREAANAGDEERRRARRPRALHEVHVPHGERLASARRLPDGRLRATSAWSTTATRSSATRASSASTPPRSRPRSASIPSLTISAVSERAVEQLIDRAADYGLPGEAQRVRAGRAERDPRTSHGTGPPSLRP